MKRDDLIRDLRHYARKRGLPFNLVKDKGKGSHYVVFVGNKWTTIQSGEYSPIRVKQICKQLEVDPASL